MEYILDFNIIVTADNEEEAVEKIEEQIRLMVEEQGATSIVDYGEITRYNEGM